MPIEEDWMGLGLPGGPWRWVALYASVVLVALVVGFVRVPPPPSPSASGALGPSSTVFPSGLAEETAPASPDAGAEVTAAPTAPTIGAALQDRLNDVNDTAVGAFLGLVTLFVLIPAGAVLLVLLLFRLRRSIDRKQLVLDDIVDATGDESTKVALTGTSQELRRRLVDCALKLYESVQGERERHAEGRNAPAPPPRSSADTALTDLIEAIAESGPDQVKFIATLFRMLFPAKGRRVVMVLGLAGQTPPTLIMSAEVTDLADPTYALLERLREAPPGGAELPSELPSGGKDDVAALTTLGLTYEAAGRWDSAQSKYEEALTKDPTFVAARKGLARILAIPDMRGRTDAFVDPAARWIALLLFKSEWLRDEEYGVDGSLKEERARIHNFVGIELDLLARDPAVASAPTYEAAIEAFKKARASLPRWWVPIKNMADAVSYLGKARDAIHYQRQAMSLYDSAIDAAEGDGYLSDEEDPAQFRASIVTQIRIDRSVARLLLGDVDGAQSDVNAALGPGWSPESEVDGNVLYSVACFRARMGERASGPAMKNIGEALLPLAFSFARLPVLAERAVDDPDLQAIRPGVEVLVRSLDWQADSAAALTGSDAAALVDRAKEAILANERDAAAASVGRSQPGHDGDRLD